MGMTFKKQQQWQHTKKWLVHTGAYLPIKISFDFGKEGHSNMVYRISWCFDSSWSISSKIIILESNN